MHIDSIDLMIFVGVVVINSFYCITAGGVEGNFVFVFCYFAAATLLIYGAEDVEELTAAFEFGREVPTHPCRGCRIEVLIQGRMCSLAGVGRETGSY